MDFKCAQSRDFRAETRHLISVGRVRPDGRTLSRHSESCHRVWMWGWTRTRTEEKIGISLVL